MLLGDSEGFTDCSFKKCNHLSTTTKKLLFSLSHLPFTSFGLYRVTEQIYLITWQESSPENTQRIYRKLLADELHWLMEVQGAAEPSQERNRSMKSKGDRLRGPRHPPLIIIKSSDQSFSWENTISPQNIACEVGSPTKVNLLQCESHQS